MPDLGGRTFLGDPALQHDGHPVGHGEGLVVVVRDEDRGGAGRDEDLPQVPGEPVPQRPVQRAERLVEQQQLGVGGQRPGERDALLLAAGEGGGAAVGIPGQPDEIEQLGDPGGPRAAPRAAQPQRVADVVAHARLGEELPVLEHQGEATLVRGHAGEVGAAPADGAGGGLLQPGDRPQQRGLAAARRPEDREDVTPRHLQRHVVDGGGPGEGHGEIGELEHQNAPTEPTRSRSTTPMTTTVTSASSTLAASAIPRWSAPGREMSW